MVIWFLCCGTVSGKTVLQSDANTIQHTGFLALADIHFDPFLSCAFSKPCPLIEKLMRAPSVQWPKLFAEYDKRAASYGDDTNYPLLISALAASKKAANSSQAAFVLVLGDMLGHQFRSRYKKYSGDSSYNGFQSFTRKTLEFLTAELMTTFNGLDIYMVVGNNDSYSGDYVTRIDGRFFNDASILWSRLITDPVNRQHMRAQFPHAGYYALTLPQQKNLRLIVLNTNLFSYKAKGQGIDKAALSELSWLHEQLQEAKKRGQHVFIAMHIPEGIDVYATLRTKLFRLISLWKSDYIRRFQIELDRYSTLISGIYAGHLHSDWFQVLSFAGDHEIPVTGVPSISPIYGNNPGFKTYTYAYPGAQIEDYVTYYYPLSAGQAWLREYDFKRTYAASCHRCSVTSGMNHLKPKGVLADYYQSYYGLQAQSRTIDTHWNPYYWCTIHNVKASDYRDCLD